MKTLGQSQLSPICRIFRSFASRRAVDLIRGRVDMIRRPRPPRFGRCSCDDTKTLEGLVVEKQMDELTISQNIKNINMTYLLQVGWVAVWKLPPRGVSIN